MASNRSVADLFLRMATKGGTTWLEQKGFGLIRPFIKYLVKAIPALVPDTPIEKVLLELYAMVPGFIEAIWPDNQRRNDTIKDIFREAIQELGLTAEEGGSKDKHKTADSGGAKTMKTIQKVWMNPDLYPGLGYHAGCPAAHHRKWVTKKSKSGKGPETERREDVPRPGFRPYDFEAFLASGARAPQIEGERENPGDTGELFVPDTCACAFLFGQDKKTLDEQKAGADKKGAAKSGGRSVADYIGKALAGKIPGVDQAKIDTLMSFLIQLQPAEVVWLDEIDSDSEFVALASAKDMAQFKMLLTAAKDRRARGILADALHLPASVADVVLKKGKAVIVAAGKATGHAVVVAGTAVGTQAKRVDDHLKDTDADLATGIRTRTQQIRAEHAARVAGRKSK